MLPGHLLQGHQREQMPRALAAGFQVARHQGGGTAQTAAMRLQDHSTPLAGRELFGAEPCAHRFIKHFCCRSRNGTQAGSQQPINHRLKRYPILLRDKQQLLGGEGM